MVLIQKTLANGFYYFTPATFEAEDKDGYLRDIPVGLVGQVFKTGLWYATSPKSGELLNGYATRWEAADALVQLIAAGQG